MSYTPLQLAQAQRLAKHVYLSVSFVLQHKIILLFCTVNIVIVVIITNVFQVAESFGDF